MKKIFTFLFILVSFTSFSQVLITDPFNYTPDAVNGLATQSSGVWSNVNTGDSILVASGNLSYSGLAASTGNKITYGGRGTDYYRGFTSQTSGTVYCSFLLNVTSIGTLNSVGSYTVAFIDGGSTNFASTVWLRLSGASGYNIGINPRTTAANSVWLPNTLSINTTYLIVIALQTVSGTANDISKIWVNPVSLGGTEPTPDATATNAGTDLSSIQRVLLRQHSDTTTPASLEIDEMRLGLTWADVTPIGSISGPTLTESALNSFGDVCINTIPNPNTFTLSGSNLTAGDITVGPLSGFSFDTTLAGTYYNSLAIAQSGGTLAPKNIYVKFTPTAVQSYSGSIPVSGGGATANVSAVGSGVSATSVSSGTASSITTTGATVSGTLTLACSAVTGYGIEYSTTSGFTPGTGIVISSSNLSGSGFTSTVNGLNPSTTYYYVAYVSTASDTSYGTQKSFNTSTPQSPNVLAGWNFFGQASPIKFAATTFNANLSKGGIDSLDNITRGDSASSSAGGNSFRTTGFKNNLISTSNKDYFQTTLKSTTGYTLSLDTINARFTGTNTYYASPGVISQFAYGFDTTNFTLIGIPDTLTSTKLSSTVSLLGIPSLHNISSNSTVYIRYYASGQTSTGGWGFNSPDASINGLEFLGAVLPVSSPTPILSATSLTSFASNCVNSTVGPNSFSISGSDLTSVDITVGPLAGYTFSSTNGGTYTNTLTITQGGGTLASTTVYVKFTPTAVQSYDGNISVSGAGATAINVAAVGSGASATTVSSGAASSITTTGATISGSLTQGCSAATSYGIQYSTTSGFTPGTGTDVASTNLSGTNFSSSLSGLIASTTYYYVAYAVTGNGTIYGTQMSFTTSAIPINPSLSATTLTSFGSNCVNSTVGPNSFSISGTNLTIADITVGPLAGYTFSSTAGGTYNATLTITQTGGTLASTPVYVMFMPTAAQSYNGNISVSGAGATAINVAAVGSGASATTVSSAAASSITATGATISGSLTQGCSAATSYGIQYSTTSGFTPGTGTDVASTNLSGTGFTSSLSGLTASTTYYYVAYAVTGNGTIYGTQMSFTTSTSIPTTSPIAAWNFFGQSSPATFTATTFDLNLVSTGGLNDITRGSTAPSSTASNSFRTTGFKNEGISTSNTDYFQTTLQPAVGYNMSLSSINTRFNGTTSFNASPGVTSQFAYSLDNTTYTLIGSPSTSTSFKLSVDLSSVSALQNIGNGTTVYIRYYASGQTTTGGWGFSSPTAADTSNGLEFMGVLSPASISPRLLSSSLPTFGNVCVSSMPNPNTFTVSGTNLNAGDITVGPLAGYTFSTSAGGSYSNTLTITQAGGTLASTTVFVMFMPSAVQSYNGNISVSGAGATTINVAATGSGVGATAIASGNPSGVSSTVAMISGTLTQGCSAATSYGIQYSTTSGFIPGTGTDVSSTNLSGNNFSSSLSGLTASTTYYYVAYAITGGGTIYGSQKSFTTTAIPVVPTLSATAFQGFGNVCLGNSAGPYSFDITGVNLTATSITVGPLAGYSFATSSAGTYSSSLTITQSGGTLVATTVYVMFAPTAVQSYSGNISINGAGAAAIDVVTTGNGTLSSLSVISGDSISVSPNVEIIKGKIDDAGCSPVVSYGIEYSSFQNFVLGTGIKVASTNLNTNDSTFSSTLTGLIQNTAYYYRAYVSNNASTVYGDQKLFITSAIPTGLTIYSNPLIRGRSVHYTLSGINLTDHYLVRIYDISGRLVFSKPLYYQLGVNFIDDNFVLPSTLSCGVYSFQVVSPEFRIQKMVLIADYTGPFGWRPF